MPEFFNFKKNRRRTAPIDAVNFKMSQILVTNPNTDFSSEGEVRLSKKSGKPRFFYSEGRKEGQLTIYGRRTVVNFGWNYNDRTGYINNCNKVTRKAIELATRYGCTLQDCSMAGVENEKGLINYMLNFVFFGGEHEKAARAL